MTPPPDLSLREATLDDLPAIGALRESVGWTVHEWALRAVIGRPRARCVVAVDGAGEMTGIGSGIAYGALGFVGNMVVAPAHRRRGVGSAILDAVTTFLEGAGCVRLELNATSDGRPLYERFGFRSTGRSATALVRPGLGLQRETAIAVRGAIQGDLAPLTAYDRPRFGGERTPILELLLTDRGFTTLTGWRGGTMVGYAGMRSDPPRIGPMLADTPAVAETLLAEAFARIGADELRLNLPPGNGVGTEWLRSLGISIEPWDGRMARGAEIARREETIYGMAVGALG